MGAQQAAFLEPPPELVERRLAKPEAWPLLSERDAALWRQSPDFEALARAVEPVAARFLRAKPPRARPGSLRVVAAALGGGSWPLEYEGELALTVALRVARPKATQFVVVRPTGGLPCLYRRLAPGTAVLHGQCFPRYFVSESEGDVYAFVSLSWGPGNSGGWIAAGGEPEWCRPLPPRLRLEAAAWLDEGTLANLCEVSRGCYAAFGGVEGGLPALRAQREAAARSAQGWALDLSRE